MKILVVDDSPTMRRVLLTTLKSIGYEDCLQAGNGIEGLEILNQENIELVITDWNMPVMNGLDFVKKIRADENLKKTPVLMVTTRGNKEDIIEAVKVNINNYIVKPFTPQVLKEKISSVMISSKISK